MTRGSVVDNLVVPDYIPVLACLRGTRECHGGNYRRHCNCIAVYPAAPESIQGYAKLAQYKAMYYDADNIRIANARGKDEYPEELAKRVKDAREEHKHKYEIEQEKKRKGEPYQDIPPWQTANETAIVMRYYHPGMH